MGQIQGKSKEKKREDRSSVKAAMRRSTSLNDVVRASVSKKATDKADPRYRVEVWVFLLLLFMFFIFREY